MCETWRQIVEVNLNGTFYVNKVVVPSMKARNYGRIVNIASIAGKEGNPNAVGLFGGQGRRHRADQVAGQGTRRYDIAVNCITPAAARTPIFDR